MFSNAKFKEFRQDVTNALKEIEKKYNVVCSVGYISYTDIDFTAKLEVKKVVEGKSPEQLSFEKQCGWFKLKPEDYGREFTYKGITYKLIDLNPKAPKYPYIAVNILTGDKIRFTEDILKLLK